MLKNKKGDIPITILVIGVVGLCILTIFSFMVSNNKLNDNFVGPGLIETIYSIQQEIIFGQGENLNPFEREVSKFNEDKKLEINFVEDVVYGKYSDGGKILVSVEYTPR